MKQKNHSKERGKAALQAVGIFLSEKVTAQKKKT